MYIGGDLGSRFLRVESIGVGGSINRLSSQGRSLRDSNLLLVVIGAAISVDVWWFILFLL